MFRSLLSLFKQQRQAPKRATFRPTLEGLEERSVPAVNSFFQTNLVSDIPGIAQITDKNLVNPWGLVAGPGTPWWINDNGTGLSTLYNGQGQVQSLQVVVPPPPGSPAGTTAAPTGIVFDGNNNFTITSKGKTGPAFFIFATEDGTISAWAPQVDGTHAILEVNKSPGAVYKGLAEAIDGHGKTFLYAANFRAGTIDIFDTHFKPATVSASSHPGGAFHDPAIPSGFAPFNVQNIGNLLYVTYAKQDAAKHDDVAGAGNGFVDVYNANGFLLTHFNLGKLANSPWGLAMAPSKFGTFGGDLLVGNFGDGHITAVNAKTGHVDGQLADVTGQPISIGGLWGLHFGNGGSAGSSSSLFFTAGLDHEAHGLFGSLQATQRAVLGSNSLAKDVLQTNLVSDLSGLAKVTDAHLINPWGVSSAPGNTFWVSNNNNGTSTLYNVNGATGVSLNPLVVGIPVPPGSTSKLGSPTGQVFTGGAGFGGSFFVFATEEGAIEGWNGQGNAVIKVNNAKKGADYTGLALGSISGHGAVLYAANSSKGTIDVFDSNFKPVTLAAKAFTDSTLPAGLTPYNVAVINGQVYVTYANEKSPNAGVIDIYKADGTFVKRFASGGPLHSPWGLVVAPSTFGAFAGDLLVGNEADGHISAFNPTTGKFVGQLTDGLGHTIAITGLWNLKFGTGGSGGDPKTLYFTAGIGGYQHGLFGALQTIDPLKPQ